MVVTRAQMRKLLNEEVQIQPDEVEDVYKQLVEQYELRDAQGWSQAQEELWKKVLGEIRGLAKNPAQFQWEYWKLREVDPKMRKLKREFNFLSLLAGAAFAVILAVCVDSLKEVIYIYIYIYICI